MVEVMTRRRVLSTLGAGVVGVLIGAKTALAESANGVFEAATNLLQDWGFGFTHTKTETGEVVATTIDALTGVRYDTVIGEDLGEGIVPCWVVGFKDGDSTAQIGAGGELVADLAVVDAAGALTYRLLDTLPDQSIVPCFVVESSHDDGVLAHLSATSLREDEQPQWVVEAALTDGQLAKLTATSLTEAEEPTWVTESEFGATGLTKFTAKAVEGVNPCFLTDTRDLDGVYTIHTEVLDPAGSVTPCFILDSQNVDGIQRIRATVAPDAVFQISVADGPTYLLVNGELVEQPSTVEPAA